MCSEFEGGVDHQNSLDVGHQNLLKFEGDVGRQNLLEFKGDVGHKMCSEFEGDVGHQNLFKFEGDVGHQNLFRIKMCEHWSGLWGNTGFCAADLNLSPFCVAALFSVHFFVSSPSRPVHPPTSARPTPVRASLDMTLTRTKKSFSRM